MPVRLSPPDLKKYGRRGGGFPGNQKTPLDTPLIMYATNSITLFATAYNRASTEKEPGPRVPRQAGRDSKMLHSTTQARVSSTGRDVLILKEPLYSV